MSTFERIQKIIADHVGADLEKVTINASLIEDLGFDSLDGLEVGMLLEQEFGQDIDTDEMEAALTVGDVVALVERSAA